MKYNLRTIKGKRIVGGDPNLATKHEIHIDSLTGQGGGNSTENNNITSFYLKLKVPQADKNIVSLPNYAPITAMLKIGEAKATGSDVGSTTIPYSTLASTWEGFTLQAIEVIARKVGTYFGDTLVYPKYNDLDDLLITFGSIMGVSKEEFKKAMIDPYFEVITEQEFYNLK